MFRNPQRQILGCAALFWAMEDALASDHPMQKKWQGRIVKAKVTRHLYGRGSVGPDAINVSSMECRFSTPHGPF